MDAFVDELLHGNVEEIIHASRGDQRSHFVEESCLDHFREYCDADVSTAELFSGYFLAHFQDAVTINDHLHGFIPPQWINNHGNWSVCPNCNVENVGIKYDVGVKNDEAITADPFECKPKRIDIVCNCERGILNEVNPLSVARPSAGDMIDDLLLLVAHNDCHISDSNC